MATSRAVLDVSGSAPAHPKAVEAWSAAMQDGWADPRRLHAEGRTARLLLDSARAALADTLGVHPDEVFLPPHHPAAARAAVLGLAAARPRSPLVLASAVEHSAVLHAGRWHADHGGAVRVVAVDGVGRVEAAAVVETIDRARADGRSPCLLAVQSGNGEIGTLQPVAELQDVAHAHDLVLVVDAAATLGMVPVPRDVDVLLGSPRAWGSVPGVGLLVVRRRVRWRPHEPGEAEGGHRLPGESAGEVDVPAAVAAAVSLAAVEADRVDVARRLHGLVARVRAAAAAIADVQVFGDPESRLPHVLTFSVLYLPGELLVAAFDEVGLGVGSGSACTADTLEPSHVLAAVGGVTHGNVRLVLPSTVQDADVERFCALLPGVVARLRDQTGVTDL